VLALHDVINRRWSGPRSVLRELLWRSNEITAVHFVGSIAYMTKVQRNTAADRWRNRLVALLLRAYDMRLASAPAPIAAVARAVYRRTPLKRKG
jgi:hypothetical protein